MLWVLNEFSEEYKENSKSVTALASSVKELSDKITRLLEKPAHAGSENETLSRLEDLITNGMQTINNNVRQISLPEKELRQLSGQLETNMRLLQNPVSPKVIHHHYIPKITWIAAALFILLALVSSGWYMTGGKLDGYIANDTKYRYLKLDTANIYLQKMLYRTDSLLRKNVAMRETVINMEEEYRHNFELLQIERDINA